MDYRRLVDLYEKLSNTSKRLEKTFIISKFLKDIPNEELDHMMLLIQGKVFPGWSDEKIGVAAQLVLKALNISIGIPIYEIELKWKELGDLGDVASEITKNKQQATLFQQKLTTKKVFTNLQSLPKASGAGTVDRKIKTIAELLTSASPLESKYITRAVLEDLRIGVGDGTVRDALVWAFLLPNIPYDLEKNDLTLKDEERINYNKLSEKVQNAFNIKNDFAKVALLVKENNLDNLPLNINSPLKVMLYPKTSSTATAFERLGKPAAFEYKYDGFRVQIHKQKDSIKLFSRRLDEVTNQFPEIVDAVKQFVNSDSCILDAEAVGFDPNSKKYLPFQKISQRIKRKHNIHEMAKNFPVELNIFDVLFWNNKTLLKEPFIERRKILEDNIQQTKYKLVIAEQLITDSEQQAQEFYNTSMNKGFEGLMGKKLDAPYVPGNRVGYGVKIKGVMDPLDLVIIKAEWGEGKRAGWFTSFTLACQNEEGEIIEIGKVGTGLKEKPEEGLSFGQLTDLLKPLIIKEEGKLAVVKPEIVISLNYEEIQQSPTYSSGFALRFPRVVALREDKPVTEIATLDEVEDLFYAQRGR